MATRSYWSAVAFFCHAECKQAGEHAEALECQNIDADCNDCRHFQRGQLIQEWLSAIVDGKARKVLVNMGTFTGQCLKFNKPTLAFPKKWTGRECFEHRRGLK